ncbi:unnamed protein product, partial [Closterium sp. NIES-54]
PASPARVSLPPSVPRASGTRSGPLPNPRPPARVGGAAAAGGGGDGGGAGRSDHQAEAAGRGGGAHGGAVPVPRGGQGGGERSAKHPGGDRVAQGRRGGGVQGAHSALRARARARGRSARQGLRGRAEGARGGDGRASADRGGEEGVAQPRRHPARLRPCAHSQGVRAGRCGVPVSAHRLQVLP